MKMDELDMRCGDCPIIEYCNDYEDTPPCSQPRFEGVNIDKFKELAETSKYGKANDIIEDVYKRMLVRDIKENVEK